VNKEERLNPPQCDKLRHSPLGTLGTVLVGLGVTQRLDVDGAGLLDLVRGAVTDENGLSSPLDDEVLAWDDQLGTVTIGVQMRSVSFPHGTTDRQISSPDSAK
jgi:hypothetical protein